MDGFVNVLKPPGMSSGTAVAIVKRLTGEKVGHAGTLDPEACGVLPVMVGRATRLFDFLVDKRKVYLTEIAFGEATDTQDAQGTVTERGENYPDTETVDAVLPQFIGDIMQMPPIYSALKRNGETLYKLALRGETAELEARPIRIDAIERLAETPRHGMLLRVTCGRGTYIRTLCHDIGRALGCPAHMRFLLREQTGAFGIDTAVTIEELKSASPEEIASRYLMPLDAPLQHFRQYDVPEIFWKKCLNGVPLTKEEHGLETGEGECIRLYADNDFIGISQAEADGTLTPRMVISKQEGWKKQ